MIFRQFWRLKYLCAGDWLVYSGFAWRKSSCTSRRSLNRLCTRRPDVFCRSSDYFYHAGNWNRSFSAGEAFKMIFRQFQRLKYLCAGDWLVYSGFARRKSSCTSRRSVNRLCTRRADVFCRSSDYFYHAGDWNRSFSASEAFKVI